MVFIYIDTHSQFYFTR